MSRYVLWLSLGLASCEVAEQLLAALSGLELLGVIPAEGFSNPGSPDYGKLRLAIAGEDDAGTLIGPVAEDLEVEGEDGTIVGGTETNEVEGHDIGSFLILADASASTEADPTCPGCPTDPNRLRVDAAKAMARAIGDCSGDWRIALHDFGSHQPSQGFQVNRVLADWTTEARDVVEAADRLGSYWGTPLWDAVYEAAGALGDDADEQFEGSDDAGRAIVVISDGADTESVRRIGAAVEEANARGVTVHAIGFGPASDLSLDNDRGAVSGLQRLAEGTGGTYGYVGDLQDLPALSESIGAAVCRGYTEVVTTFEEPPESGSIVNARVRSKKNPAIAVPFSFRAP